MPSSGVGLDLLEIEPHWSARSNAGRAWPTGCSPTPSASTPPAKRAPGQHLAARFCAKEAVAKALALEGWSFTRRGGGGHRRRADVAPERAAPARGPMSSA